MIKRLLSIIVFTTGVSAAAFAQQNQTLRDRDPDLDAVKKVAADLQQANFHSGVWYLLSRFRIADAGFSEGSVVPTGDSEGGLTLKVEAPQRLYFVPRKKTVYSVEFVPAYNFFQEGARNGQFDYLVRGDAQYLFNHLYLDLYALRADQLRAHVADINRFATAQEDEYGVAGEVKYSSRTSGLFTVRLRDTEYPENRFQPDPEGNHIAVQVLDRREKNARLSMLHKTFPRTSLFVAAEGSDYDFKRVAAYESRRTYVGAGLQYDAGRTTVRLEGGPMKLDFKDSSRQDYDGFTARLRTVRSNGRWTYQFGADRDIGFSIFLDNAYYVATSAQVGADYQANRRLTLHARSAYEQDEFETPVEGRLRTDDVSYSSVGFTYALRRLRVGADVGWYERDTTAFGDEASGIRYVLRLSFIP
ncbi:MAG TPA: outer membrane beta-barrel protein [Thermoanaerobaculia bacterium]